MAYEPSVGCQHNKQQIHLNPFRIRRQHRRQIIKIDLHNVRFAGILIVPIYQGSWILDIESVDLIIFGLDKERETQPTFKDGIFIARKWLVCFDYIESVLLNAGIHDVYAADEDLWGEIHWQILQIFAVNSIELQGTQVVRYVGQTSRKHFLLT